MSFPKFSEWMSLREEAPQATQGQQVQNPVAKQASAATNQAIAKTVGLPKEKRVAMLKMLAQKAANNPSAKPKDIAAIAAAAEEDS